MLHSLVKPSFLVPFSLVTPFLFIGLVGITIFELIVISGFLWIVLKNKHIPNQRIIFLYVFLLVLGYFLAAINGFISYGLPIGLGDLKVGYWILLALSGFFVGYKHFQSLDMIAESKAFRIILVILSVFIISYPFLGTDLKYAIMTPFYSPSISVSELGRIDSPRFPGLGINSNVYAFMLLIVFHISVNSVLRGRMSWLYLLLLFTALAICGSKTVIFLATLLLFSFIFFSSSIRKKQKFRSLAIIFIMASIIIGYLNFTDKGKGIMENIVIIDRFLELAEDRTDVGRVNPLSTRQELWLMGIKRVSLSPIIGIKKSSISDDINPVQFCCPHNEFIAFWTFTGLLGLAAYITLIFGLMYKNLKQRNSLFWNLLYFSLCFQMFFDAAFQTTSFITLFFILIGVNLKELSNIKKTKINESISHQKY
jgi:hypothetical protein